MNFVEKFPFYFAHLIRSSLRNNDRWVKNERVEENSEDSIEEISLYAEIRWTAPGWRHFVNIRKPFASGFKNFYSDNDNDIPLPLTSSEPFQTPAKTDWQWEERRPYASDGRRRVADIPQLARPLFSLALLFQLITFTSAPYLPTPYTPKSAR